MKIRCIFLSSVMISCFSAWSMPPEPYFPAAIDERAFLLNGNQHALFTQPRRPEIHIQASVDTQQIEAYIAKINQSTYSGTVPLIPIVSSTLVPFVASMAALVYYCSQDDGDSCILSRGAVYGSFGALFATNTIVLADHIRKMYKAHRIERTLRGGQV